MKGCSKKEDPDVKKKYVFFSDPDIIVQRAETSAVAAQYNNSEYQKRESGSIKRMSKEKPSSLSTECDLKDLENILAYHSVKPYPFTFISAVKRKQALDDGSEAYRKAHEPNIKSTTDPTILLKSDGAQNLYEIAQKMDFIRPLKVPDLKISAKKLDFSNRENCAAKEIISTNFETPSKELVHERADKPSKSFERVQRKLDFSTSDISSTINSEVEPLKVPNISISSNLSKKKEYVRESSREKENRTKRIRKDDSLFSKQDESRHEFSKRSRSPRHISRKEFSNNVGESTLTAKGKNDRLPLHMPRESDFVPTKSKIKNFATSTAKKVTDKRHKSINTRSLKSRDTSVESKNRSYSNESLSERSSKIPDQITVRESRNMYENFDYRYKEDLHMLRQVDDRQMKQHKVPCQLQGKIGNSGFKEQSKRSEKAKPSTSKIDNKLYIMNLKESEGVESVTDSNISVRTQSPSTVSTQQTKNKDPEKVMQNMNVGKSNKATEDLKHTDDSLIQCTSSNTKREEESFTQSVTTTVKQTSINSNESNLNDSALSNALLDPRRISFRDENCSQLEEFYDLVTPDMNLMPRSKRKRHFIQNTNLDADSKCLKHNKGKTEVEQEGVPLLHPTALHMQFQAELHLLDSFNESLRQVMDVEKCLYNVKQDQDKELPLQHSQSSEQAKSHFCKVSEERNVDDMEHCNEMSKSHKHVTTDKAFPSHLIHHSTSQGIVNEFDNINKITKPSVKAVEVQTQTVNDMATQTEIRSTRRNVQSRCSEICGIPYERGFTGDSEVPHLSLDSVEQFEDLDQIEEISLPSKLRTMSEISLHETTSSIRTETGTEISISTRDVTCSFNKYLDLEIAQLIKDEKQRYDKIEMLFKSREKTLNDRTKKLVKLEEQKRALRDTGQDSRVSSVKKKQRALLLKLQQEKDEMNRLKELHKIASQERKLMLQKQRNMFNPQMSTKNILTKLKRSADSQSPRRLSGPMKGYDIRSNSSMSSLVDSDKSQHDRSQTDIRTQMSENELPFTKMDLPKCNKFPNFSEEANASFLRFDESNEAIESNISPEKCPYKIQKDGSKSKYEIKSRKFEEKMPKADVIRLKSHQHSVEPNLVPSHSIGIPGKYIFEEEKSPDVSELLQQNLNKSISEHVKSESDTLVEELSKKSRPSQVMDNHFQNIVSPRESLKSTALNSEVLPEEISSGSQDTVSKTSKSSQVSEDVLQAHSKSSKRSSKSIPTDMSKKTQYSSESKSNFKRRSSKCQKSKSSSSILTENILRSKSNSQISEELIKHHNKRTRMEKEFIQLDRNDENASAMDKRAKDKNLKLSIDKIDDHDSKENVLGQKMLDKNVEAYENSIRSQGHNFDNFTAKSQIRNFSISHQSSEESDRNYFKSVVVRSQDHNLKTSKKLEQILNAREAALTSRKNCVEEWMAWHAKLRTEEDRVARMEQAALKLVTATSNVFSQQDTTVSSDTSDIEGRIELLTEKLAERRMEMSRLKREARKQTKQKLRALEANLLNQIKKYDTTIYEMRKKLESKKGIYKDSDKLAIESRSLADFKVPEIPLKKIQDIFKSSDLLRSRSESDLLSSRRLSARDPTKCINLLRNEASETDYDKTLSERMIKACRSARTPPDHRSLGKLSPVNRSAQSVLDESASEQIEIDKIGSASMSSISDDARSEKNIPYSTREYANEVHSVSDGKRSSITEDVRTEISVAKSEADILARSHGKISKNEASAQSDLREYKSDFETFSEQSKARTVSSESGANKTQDVEPSHVSLSKSNDVQSPVTEINTESANDAVDFSKKLHFLHLNNQNLNEDISSLENELKILSEMMSRLNKKPAGENKQEAQHEEKSTSKDISEILSNSSKSEEIENKEIARENKSKDSVSSQMKTNSDNSHHFAHSTILKSVTSSNNNSNSIAVAVDNVIYGMIPQNETSSRSTSHEIDYKARGKEILNEIEKSISERIKANENNISLAELSIQDNNVDLYEDTNKQQLNDVTVESNKKSVSEVYSKSVPDKESRSPNRSQKAYPDEKEIEENLNNLDNRVTPDPSNASLIPSEKSVSPEKDKSLHQYTCSNHNSIINDVLTGQTRSESKSDVTSKQLSQNLSKDASVVEYVSELLKKQASPRSSNSIKTIESLKDLSDYTNEVVKTDHSQGVTDVGSLSKVEGLQLPSVGLELIDELNESKCSIGRVERIESKCHSRKSIDESKQAIHNRTLNDSRKGFGSDESQPDEELMDKTSLDKDDWTISDSFDVQQDVDNSAWERSHSQHSKLYNDESSIFLDSRDVSRVMTGSKHQISTKNEIDDLEDVSLFIPKSESTNIDGIRDETISDCHVQGISHKSEDILHVIAKDDKDQIEESTTPSIEAEDFKRAIYESVTKILDKVEKSIEDSTIKEKIENHSTIIGNKTLTLATEDDEKEDLISSNHNLEDHTLLENQEKLNERDEESTQNIVTDKNIKEDTISNKIAGESAIEVDDHSGIKNEDETYQSETKSREIIITELEPDSVESESLSELEIDVKIELADEEVIEANKCGDGIETEDKIVQEEKLLEAITEQDSSDGEQLDNLVEVVESGLDVIEKQDKLPADSVTEAELISQNKIDIQTVADQSSKESSENVVPDIAHEFRISKSIDIIGSDVSPNIINKTFDILKDPEYEDISEESLEVSEIFDNSERQKSVAIQKSSSIPERYEAIQKSEDVLKILDEITQKSLVNLASDVDKFHPNKYASEHSEKLKTEISDKDSFTSPNEADQLVDDVCQKSDQPVSNNLDVLNVKIVSPEIEDQSIISPNEAEGKEKQEQDVLSESSEDRDTPKGVSEIEMDSPRDHNDSRLNIDALNDDLLTNSVENQELDSKNTFHAIPIVATSEKDIEVMIDKLKASLEQPGVEVADWEAKLLRIEQLQIELEIKKLEAEEVSYYVREIPNKPPPPYTPPGGGTRILTSLGSPSPPPAVIPSNIEELTAFTERATALIFKAKEAGEDIMSLEAPSEICELTKENDETVKKDRRIYNTFLFDLCKETVAEVYQAEYEKPGPSWTKPSVKTKPLMKIPRTLDELNAYVNKEVATLFGFKTKLQRENMVMRWSRKRRDRVDELLAREAQAEEAEWTKFHHDELAVKNGLTVTILDTLLMETVNVVKVAYAKKRKVMV